jgi:hypothetical protein
MNQLVMAGAWCLGPPAHDARRTRGRRAKLGRTSLHLSDFISNRPTGIFGFYFNGPAFYFQCL